MERSLTGAQQCSGQPHLVEGLQEHDVQGAASIDEDSIELDVLDDGANYKTIPPWVIVVVEGDGDLGPLKVHGGGGWDHHDLLGCEFLLPHWFIWVGATIDVLDLLTRFREVALGFFRHFLLIGRFGRLEHLIYETLESIVIPGFVLSLGMENTDMI
jgi:hypothetical protein